MIAAKTANPKQQGLKPDGRQRGVDPLNAKTANPKQQGLKRSTGVITGLYQGGQNG